MCVIAYKNQGVSWTACKSVFNSSGGKVRKHEEDKLPRKDSKPRESTKSKQTNKQKLTSTCASTEEIRQLHICGNKIDIIKL